MKNQLNTKLRVEDLRLDNWPKETVHLPTFVTRKEKEIKVFTRRCSSKVNKPKVPKTKRKEEGRRRGIFIWFRGRDFGYELVE